MKPLEPTDLYCYPQVSYVIGEESAEKELQRVIECEECYNGPAWDLASGVLPEAFSWRKSPQGSNFWAVISNNEYPYEKVQVKPVLQVDRPVQGENSGGSCDYYKAPITHPTTAEEPYVAECNDVIEALDMTYAEANMFKEIWRSAAARTLGKLKAGHNEVRGAEKVVFFANRNLIQKSK